MEQADLMNILQDVDFSTVDLIGQQQLSQINSLKIQVKSLENQLEEKNEEISFLRKRQHKSMSNITQIIRNLIKSFNSTENEKIVILQSIDNEKDFYSKIEQFAQFLIKHAQSISSSASRACGLLNDHLKLIEQANAGEITTFAISSPKTMQKILLSQAEKTKEFLGTSQINESSVLPKVTEILNTQFSAELRTEGIKKFINNSEMPNEELKVLLFQEIVFVDSLRNYIQTNNNKINGYNTQIDLKQQTEQIERKLKPKLEQQIRNEIENILRIEITNELTDQIKAQTENDLRDKIEAEVQLNFLEQQRNKDNFVSDELYEKARNEVEQELKPQIERELREQIVQECCQKGTVLYNQISAEILKSQENQHQNQNQNLFYDSSQKRNEIESKLRETFQTEYNKKEKILKERSAAELENKLRLQEQQLRIEIESTLRSKIESEIYNNYNNKISQTRSNSQNASNYKQMTSLPEDIEAVSFKLCAALGIENRNFLTSSQFCEVVSSLSNKVLKIREHFDIKGRNIIRPFLDMEKQVSHMDQLHTQTRSLLVRQSQIIAELRKQTGTASWITWAKRLYSSAVGVEYLRDDITELRMAIEERVAAAIAHEQMWETDHL